MNFATVVRTAAAVAFVAAAVWGQSSAAYAEEIVVESRDETAITHGVSVLAWARVDGVSSSTGQTSTCCDDVVVDGTIITGDSYDAQTGSSDPEWKYVPVRRTASADADSADGDHDILDDPADDLLPPAKPASDEESASAFDGRLLTADDLTSEQENADDPGIRIPITIKHGV